MSNKEIDKEAALENNQFVQSVTVKLNSESKEEIVINEPINSNCYIVFKLFVAAIGLVLYSCAFRYAFYRQDGTLDFRIWEDLYGRGLFFFLFSVACYKYLQRHNEHISFFELEASYRFKFAIRMATTCLSYGCLAIALSKTNLMGLNVVMLCLCIPVMRTQEEGFSKSNLVSILVCFAGCLMQYSPSNVSIEWYIYSLVSSVLLSISFVF